MSRISPDASLPWSPAAAPSGRRRAGLDNRKQARAVPTQELPVSVSVTAVDGSWTLRPRAAWDVSRSGASLGVLDDEVEAIRLGAPVRVRLETAEAAYEVVARVAHLSRYGAPPVWSCVLGVALDPPEGLPEALTGYIARIVRARGLDGAAEKIGAGVMASAAPSDPPES